MLSRATIEQELRKTSQEIKQLHEQIKLKEMYMNSLRCQLREIDEYERSSGERL